MGIYLGDKQGTLYKGSYKPVNLYHGDKKAAGWELSEKTGTELSWDDTYNDKVLSAVVEGKSEQEQTVQGKNLIDMSKVRNSRADTTGTWDGETLTVTGLWYCQVSVRIAKNTNYYFSTTRSGEGIKAVAIFSTSNGTTLGTQIRGFNVNNFTFNSGDYDWILVLFYGSNGTGIATSAFSQNQLELGSTATSYEPFVPDSPSPDYPSPIISTGEVSGIDLSVTGNAGQSYSAHRDIILRSLPDGTCDEWDAVTGTVTRRVGVKVFDGTEAGFSFRRDKATMYPNTAIFILNRFSSAGTSGISSHFNVGANNVDANHVRITSTFLEIGMLKPELAGWSDALTDSQKIALLNAFLAAQYAAGTSVTVYYKLAAPTTEQIDPAPLPTYPRYTALSCNAEVTARVRVVEK